MSGKTRSYAVTILLVVSGLFTIGLGVYSIKLDLSLSQQSQEPLRPLPRDLSTFSQDELGSMIKAIELQKDKYQESYQRDKDTRHRKAIVYWFMLINGVLMFFLAVVNSFMMWHDRTKASDPI